MDPLYVLLLMGVAFVAAQEQAPLLASFQGVDKNAPEPVIRTRANFGAAQRRGPPPSSTEIGGIPVGQFKPEQSVGQESPTGRSIYTEAESASTSQAASTNGAEQASVSQAASTGGADSASFTPIGLTGTGTTWAEAIGYAPAGTDASKSAELSWAASAQAQPTNAQQATPTDFSPLAGGAGSGAGPMGGLVGGAGGGADLIGGLMGGTGGGADLMGGFMGASAGGLLEGLMSGGGAGMFGPGPGGMPGGAGGGLLGGGADLFGGMGMGGLDGLFGGMGGMFGGNSGRPSQGLGSRSGRQGEMIRNILLLQMLGGGDAPDPPPPGARGRRRGPPSPMEQLIRLEQINTIRQRQIDRAMRNRMRPENQRGQRGGLPESPGMPGPYPPSFAGPEPPLRAGPYPPNFDGSTPTRMQSPDRWANRMPGRWSQEAMARQDAQSQSVSPGGTQGQEAVPAEGEAASGQGPSQRRPWTNQRGPDMMGPNTYPPEFPPSGPRRFNRGPPLRGPGGFRNMRPPGVNSVPRNIQELMSNPMFQRRLRLNNRPTPMANSADVRADRADRMADYMDNLQAMNPIQRMMMGGGMGAARGLMGGSMGGMMGGAPGGMMGLLGMPGLGGMGLEGMGMGGLLGLGNPGLTGMGGMGGPRMGGQMAPRFAATNMPSSEPVGGPMAGPSEGRARSEAVGGATGEAPVSAGQRAA